MTISTHTPLARRDLQIYAQEKGLGISTHTPLARRDGLVSALYTVTSLFQLTRLLRGATAKIESQPKTQSISTHTPLARRDSAK